MIQIALLSPRRPASQPRGTRVSGALCIWSLALLLAMGASASAQAQVLIGPQPGLGMQDAVQDKPFDPAELLPIPLPERFRPAPPKPVDTLQGPVAPAPPLAGIPSCGVRLPRDTRPRIGLALGGGGARGIAHISLLRMLEAAHVPVDCIAGTSMGSLVGGLYASGMSVDDLQDLVVSTNWSDLFNDALPREQRSYREKQDDRAGLATVGVGIGASGLKISPGVLQGEKIVAMFEKATLPVSAITDFNLLPIPFRAVATDLNTGDAVVLDHGNLAMSMRASMSLPGIFQPAQIDNMALLDGGLANQVPIDVVRAMGADIVIAINVGTPLEKLDTGASLLAVVNQIAGMMTTRNTTVQMDSLGPRDVAIVPDFDGKVSTGDFSKAKVALAIGQAAAVEARPRVAALGVSPQAYAQIVASRGPRNTAMPVIEFVRMDNRTTYDDAVLLASIPIAIGQPFDPAKTEEGVLRAYGLNTLSVINYEVVHEDGRAGVVLHATPKPQGPNYIQLGLQMSSTLDGTFETNLRAAILVSPLTPNGAEGRVTVDLGTEPGLALQYYLPLQPDARNLFYAKASWQNPNIYVYNDNGDNIATYAVNAQGVEVQLVHEFDQDSAVLVGASRSNGHGSVQVGDPSLGAFSFDDATLFARFNVDSLDSLYYPTSGWYSEIGYTAARTWLGSDTDWDRVDMDILAARSFGAHALQVGAGYHTTVSGVLPIQDLYRLGGRGRLAGFRFNELTGQNYAIVLAGYSYQASKLWGREAVLGATIEYGNAWETRSDIRFSSGILNASLYAGFNSWIGPMSFGYGWRQDTSGLIFIQVGQPF